MNTEKTEYPQLPQCAVMVSADLYDEIFLFIDCVRAITMNKKTFDEALIILKKMIDAKV